MRAVALFACEGDDASELTFNVGAVIVDLRKAEEEGDGWWYGRLDGTTTAGLFPDNYVRFEDDPPPQPKAVRSGPPLPPRPEDEGPKLPTRPPAPAAAKPISSGAPAIASKSYPIRGDPEDDDDDEEQESLLGGGSDGRRADRAVSVSTPLKTGPAAGSGTSWKPAPPPPPPSSSLRAPAPAAPAARTPSPTVLDEKGAHTDGGHLGGGSSSLVRSTSASSSSASKKTGGGSGIGGGGGGDDESGELLSAIGGTAPAAVEDGWTLLKPSEIKAALAGGHQAVTAAATKVSGGAVGAGVKPRAATVTGTTATASPKPEFLRATLKSTGAASGAPPPVAGKPIELRSLSGNSASSIGSAAGGVVGGKAAAAKSNDDGDAGLSSSPPAQVAPWMAAVKLKPVNPGSLSASALDGAATTSAQQSPPPVSPIKSRGPAPPPPPSKITAGAAAAASAPASPKAPLSASGSVKRRPAPPPPPPSSRSLSKATGGGLPSSVAAGGGSRHARLAAPLAEAGIPLDAAERYVKAFDAFDETGSGLLHAEQVRPVWLRSLLDNRTLGLIWRLVYKKEKQALGCLEFCLGLYLIDECLRGKLVPTELSLAQRRLLES
ncbi:hypothetical protein DFJ73DRAFT_534125 [Zopfochytrium polystomum]|nr:hypothetical protein DFJ73DRAFT_534125 [Zopfochytrium polystomum]